MHRHDRYQMQSAGSSYAYEPQTVGHESPAMPVLDRDDASRPYGYMGKKVRRNPLAYDPSLSPTYNGLLHGE